MFSPLFFVLMSGVQQKSSVPCPVKRPDKRDEALKNSAPRYHPVSARAQVPSSSQNAVTGRNRSVLVSFRLSHRPLRSELQPARTRKPFQPVKLLSLPCGTDLLSPSLRLGVFRFITVCILPHFAEVCKGCARSFRKCRQNRTAARRGSSAGSGPVQTILFTFPRSRQPEHPSGLLQRHWRQNGW